MSLIKEWKHISLDELNQVAIEVKEICQKPAVIVVTGEMGAGKTTFCQFFARGCKQELLSPTYSLLTAGDNLLHGDLYRLDSPEELSQLELSLYQDGKEWFLFEWGLKFVARLKREFSSDHHFYELKIDIEEALKSDFLKHDLRCFKLKNILD